jgi:hypothetical protein
VHREPGFGVPVVAPVLASGIDLKLARGIGFAAALAAASVAAAQPFVAAGGCRDGAPNGAYELRGMDGRLRISGAYAKGRRTGTFLFWAADGVRIAVIPYDDGAISGTVATWYAEAGPRGQPRRKLEAPYVGNVLHGVTRAWYPNGRLRGEYRYERGELAEATAWSESGGRLPDADARRLAAADRLVAEKLHATLERMLADNAPHCG